MLVLYIRPATFARLSPEAPRALKIRHLPEHDSTRDNDLLAAVFHTVS